MNDLANRIPIQGTNNAFAIDPNSFVIRGGEFLFRMGDRLEGVFMVNSGTVKLSRINGSGDEQIIGFYMAGDLIGLDALEDGASRSTASVLETSNISLIPFKTLQSGSGKIDYGTFIQQIGASFNRDNEHAMMLSQCTAGRRVAWFLINMSDTMARRGLQDNEFLMPMLRSDIALFLGLAVETVSRELARLCEKNLIKKDRRHIELLNIDCLRGIANGNDTFNENLDWTLSINGTNNRSQATRSH